MMRQSNLRARLLSPLEYAFAASLLLTGTWMVLQQQVAIPRGLTRSIFADVDSTQLHSATPTRTIGPDFLEQVVDLPRPFRVRWDGYWFSPFAERVTVQASADSGVSVYLDGELLLRHDAASSGSPAVGTITLSPGAHQLVVDYDHENQGHELSVQWTPGVSELRLSVLGCQPRSSGSRWDSPDSAPPPPATRTSRCSQCWGERS